jgi:hypothetical protein
VAQALMRWVHGTQKSHVKLRGMELGPTPPGLSEFSRALRPESSTAHYPADSAKRLLALLKESGEAVVGGLDVSEIPLFL